MHFRTSLSDSIRNKFKFSLFPFSTNGLFIELTPQRNLVTFYIDGLKNEEPGNIQFRFYAGNGKIGDSGPSELKLFTILP